MSAEVDAYIGDVRRAFGDERTELSAELGALLPAHIECMSYAMPGFRAPGKKGKMVAGYAAFTHHCGLYPHSGNIVPLIDCTPFKTSKSGVLFTPDQPLPPALIERIVRARQAELNTR